METKHIIYFLNSKFINKHIKKNSINLIITSPPYPMIKMWDKIFNSMDDNILKVINSNPNRTFELMHNQLNKIWKKCIWSLKEGGFICINIGDATRTINKNFSLYPNHSKIIEFFKKQGLHYLPSILWNKPTNRATKFMGSGMLPSGAYVAMENEYILIFRKGEKRKFNSLEKIIRRESAIFWTERNKWYSDIWKIIPNRQKNKGENLREVDASYPFELAYRLINMYSIRGDTVLDPFVGTGTTIVSAIASGRNSIGFEIDNNYSKSVNKYIMNSKNNINKYIKKRISNYKKEIMKYNYKRKQKCKYFNESMKLEVTSSQEKNILHKLVKNIFFNNDKSYTITYTNLTPKE